MQQHIEMLKRQADLLEAQLQEVKIQIEDAESKVVKLSDIKPGTKIQFRPDREVSTIVYDPRQGQYKLGGVYGNPAYLYDMPWRSLNEMFDYLKDSHYLID